MTLEYSNEIIIYTQHVLYLGMEVRLKSHMCTAIDSDGLVVSTLSLIFHTLDLSEIFDALFSS